jgi:two-component system sensor histidine kinase EvgS
MIHPGSRRRIVATLCAWPASACLANVPDFSAEERQWIADHPVVRFAADTRLAPIEMDDRGEYRGIAAEFLEAIGRRSGLRFQYTPTPTWHDAVQALLDGHVDMTPNISPMRVATHTRWQLSFTKPYFVSPTLVVTQGNKPVVASLQDFADRTVAIRAGGSYERILRANHPDIRLLPVTRPEEGLAAVVTGAADAAIGTEAVLSPVLRRKYAGLLGVAGTIDTMPYMSQMAVRHDMPLLFSIIQKSLDSLSAEETDRMLERVLDRVDYGAPTLTSIVQYRGPHLVMIALLIVLLAGFAACARIAHRRAKRGELAKSRFLAVMSHEIRTPMNAVLASIEMLQHSRLDTRQRRLAAAAASASETLLDLLDNVLDLSRLDTRHLELVPVPTDLGLLVAGVADIVRIKAREKRITIDVVIEGIDDDDLLVDPTRLRQVLLNLMSNAVKFTEAGGVALDIRFAADHDDGALHVRVTDTGIGIATDQQARVFHAYSQADSSTTRRYGGTGLGLAICKELVELMGGWITLESTVGKGTCVAFSIPGQRMARTPPAPTVPSENTRPAATTAGPLLIIEDHPDNRYIIGEQMRDLEVDALIVADGEAALFALARRPYALILMDCHMPGMDGYETTRRIRRMETSMGRERSPIIAISAATGTDHLGLCVDSGMDGVLRKPLRLDELRNIMRLWLGKSPSHHESSAAASESIDAASLYRRSFHDDAGALRDALARHDRESARHHVHRLKGAAMTANCFAIAHHAEYLEKMLHSGNREAYEPEILHALARIDVEVSRL